MFAIPQRNVALSKYTTLKTGGTAKYFFAVTTLDELETAIQFAKQNELPFFIIGGGSNLLALDTGYDGVIIKISLHGIVFGKPVDSVVNVTVAAGEILDNLVAETVKKGFWGMENLSHIPGTVGATPVQNVGAYGVEVSELIETVTVFDTATGKALSLTAEESQFGYRDSIFKTVMGKRYVITSVTFNLSLNSQPRLKYADLSSYFVDCPQPTQVAIREAVISIRSQKFPDWRLIGTAGSFFKNPIVSRDEVKSLLQKYPTLPVYEAGEGLVKLSLGFILDKICGLKGYQKNHVGLFHKQALVLVADTGATSVAIEEFSQEIAKKVFVKTKLKIEFEVTRVE